MFRLMHAIPIWILFIVCIYLPLVLLGFVMVPIALTAGAYKVIPNTDPKWNRGKDIVQFTWAVMLPWNNFTDGIYVTNYFDHGFVFTVIRWCCVRNPVNGLSTVPYLSCKIDPDKIRFIGSFINYDGRFPLTPTGDGLVNQYDTKTPQWFFAWQGLYSNFYWQFILGGKLRRIWIGWKIFPTDIYGVTEYRKPGAGFALQFKVVE